MSDDPRPPFAVPPGAGADVPAAPVAPPTPPVAPPPPPVMPPLGPPYLTPPGGPPSPQYPPSPPEQWPASPPLLPTPIPPPPAVPRWTDNLRRPGVLWVAGAVVLALVAGALVARSTNDGLPRASPTPTTVTAPRRLPPSTSSSTESNSSSQVPATTAPQDLDSAVLDIEKFVEQERGLKYKTKVDVHLAGDGEFQSRLLKDFDKERPALLEEQEVLSALGLLTKGSDVIEESRSLLSAGVVGFYDPETKQLVVRGTAITPYVREVLAHELTHALDDQWFNLNRPELDNPDDESGFGFVGLAEGNARRIENAYVGSMSRDEQRQATNEEQQLVAQHPEIFSLPPILLTLLQAPYDAGPPFIDAVLAAGGQAALDHAFTAPPITSEQILDPSKYLAGEGPVDVTPPTPEGAASNVGVLGELLLREMLFESLSSGAEVDRAVTGWGGDRYVTWKDASGAPCLRDTFVGDTPTDTSELVDAMTTWADDHNGTVDRSESGPATLTVCAG